MKLLAHRLIAVLGLFLLIVGCKPLKHGFGNDKVKKTVKKSTIFKNHFTGFLLFDPSSRTNLFEYNADLHFTPASNTKILTTYACLQVLKDSIPTFKIKKDSIISLYPYGDPTFLHPDFPKQPALTAIYKQPLRVHLPHKDLPFFGPGWAWDDYPYSFQPERSFLPIYANELRVSKTDTIRYTPAFFKDFVTLHVGPKPEHFVARERNYNLFHLSIEYPNEQFVRKIPFIYSDELLSILLSDTTKSDVSIVSGDFSGPGYEIIYNQPTLPVLALMMQRSDNFLAEQLLFTAARVSGHNNLNAFRQKLLDSWQLPDDIRWVDGSGLSRYNLFSPEALVTILDHIYTQTDWETIKYLFPNGGKTGTIKNWYPGVDEPYIFAKTGTLSNNHCLSGYIVTNSGRKLIFSFMNNNYLSPVSDVKSEMQRVLETIRDHY